MLAGMGYDSLSVAPNFLPVLKFAIRAFSRSEAADLVQKLLVLPSAKEIKEQLDTVRERLGAAILDS